MTLGDPFELVRPLVWLAVLAFVTGFGGYLMAAGGTADTARQQVPALSATAAHEGLATRL